MNIKNLIFFIFIFLLSIPVYSSEIMTSADRNSGKGYDFTVYYMQSKQDIDINVSSVEQIYALNLPPPGNIPTVSTFSYIGTVSEKYELKRKTASSVIKISKRFGEKLHPYLKFGVFKTELKGYGSKWESNSDGILAGGGLKYVLLQDTVVTPAFAVSCGLTFENVEIKKINNSDINLKLKTTELETTFWTSKKIRSFEGWAGLQLSFIDGKFEDSDIDGDSASVFLGLSYGFFENIGVTSEIFLINLKDINFHSGIKAGF